MQDEFDKIVDQVNALEMEALKQGNGFVPKEEITPAEAASDVTFAVDPNLVAKATADSATTKSDLPLVVNDYVASYINFFANTQKGHNTLLHSFQRSGRYKAMIQRVMAEEGVPQDLIYLAVAESGFQPQAVNRSSRAGGMWQFMPARRLRAGAQRLRGRALRPGKIHARLRPLHEVPLRPARRLVPGHGRLRLGRGQRAARGRRKPATLTSGSFTSATICPAKPPTTCPRFSPPSSSPTIPTQYGFDDVTLDPPVLTDTVTINYAIDLRLVSDLVGAPVDEIEALNPSLLRMVTPPDASFDLHLPAGTATLFEQRAALIPEAKRNSWRYHPVVAGDTLASVAQEYRVPVAELASANQLSPTDSVAGIEALVVPVPPAAEPLTRTRLYIVRRGDTLVTIADRFGVSLSQLRRWNGIPSGIRVEPGRRLRVAEPAPVRASTTHRRRTSATGAKAGTVPTPSPPRRSPVKPTAQSAVPRRSRPIRRPPGRPLAPSPAPRTSRPARPGLRRNSKKPPQAAFDACVLLVFMCKL